MFVKYVVLIAVSTFVIICYLNEHYLASTFVHLSAVFPQLHATVFYVRSVLLKLLSTGLGQKMPAKRKEMLFTKEVLKKYSDTSSGLYLAILGKVYDVGKGEKFYGPGGSYHFFTGRDGSRAFITGEFTESGLTDDVTDLTAQELHSLHEWAQFYHKEYRYKGKLIGRYYDAEGQPTPYYHQVKKLITKAKKTKQEERIEKLSYPPCNSEWSNESGSRVWCTKMSGGIERDWTGVPRQLYEPGSQTYRCACIRENEIDGPKKKGNIKEYPDCNPKSTSCWVYS